jgi:hypothetical protein
MITKRLSVDFTVWLLCAAAVCAQTEVGETFTVNPELGARYEEVGEVPPLFNAVFSTLPPDSKKLLPPLNLNGARVHMRFAHWGLKEVPGMARPQTPGQVYGYGVRKGKAKLTQEESNAAWDRWYQQDFKQIFDQIVPSALSGKTNNASAQLNGLIAGGLTNNLLLMIDDIDAYGVYHLDGVNRYYDGIISAIRKHAPEIKHIDIQFTCEPDNPAFHHGYMSDGQTPVDAYIKIYESLDKFLKEHHPDVRLIGPSLTERAAFSQSGIQNWSQPLLTKPEHPLEFLAYHPYNKNQWVHLAWLTMFQALAEQSGRPRPLGYVTEFNTMLYVPNYGSERMRYYAEQIFMGLDNPDKLYGLSWHMMFHANQLLTTPAQEADIIGLDHGEVVLPASYYMLQTLAELRGQLLFVNHGASNSIQTAASRPDDRTVVMGLLNSGHEATSIAINIDSSLAPAKLFRRNVHPRGGNQFDYTETELPVAQTQTFTLIPGEVTALIWRFDSDLPQIGHSMQVRDYLAPLANRSMNKPVDTVIKLPGKPSANHRYMLRFAVGADSETLANRPRSLTLNGKKMTLFASQREQGYVAPREYVSAPTIYYETLLYPEQLQQENRLTFEADEGNNLLFASVRDREYPEANTARQETARAIAQRAKRIPLEFSISDTVLFDGQTRTAILKLSNPGSELVSYDVKLQLPDGVEDTSPAHFTVTVPAGETTTVRRKLTANCHGSAKEGVVQLTVSSLGLESAESRIQIKLFPNHFARFSAEAPTPAQWDGIPGIPHRQGDIIAETKLAWNGERLFFRVEVNGEVRPQSPSELPVFWQVDGVEFFMDLKKSKTKDYSSGCAQLFATVRGFDHSQVPLCGIVRRIRKNDKVEQSPPELLSNFTAAYSLLEPGYVLTGSFPWSDILKGYSPIVGQVIGMDMCLNHPVGGKVVSTSLLGLGKKNHLSPATWGNVTLLND